MADAKGAEGAGRYPALAGNPRLASNLYPVQVVLQGKHGMPPFGPFLDDAQVAAVVNHVRTHFGNAFQDDVAAADVAGLRKVSRNDLPPRVAQAAQVQAMAQAAAAPAGCPGLVRHRTPGSDFPILMAVEVPSSCKTVYLSGVVPSAIDPAKGGSTIEAYGDTRTQTVSVLKNVERNLKRLNLSMSDVIKMQVFLVGDPAQQGRMDFKGLMEGYTQFFGTKEQPNLPTRSVFQVSGLANPGWLVEIEVVAAVKE